MRKRQTEKRNAQRWKSTHEKKRGSPETKNKAEAEAEKNRAWAAEGSEKKNVLITHCLVL